MALPQQNITLSPEEIAKIEQRLAELRHNINNYLNVIVAASELIRVKPDSAQRMHEQILAQPERVKNELRAFSHELHLALKIGDDENYGG